MSRTCWLLLLAALLAFPCFADLPAGYLAEGTQWETPYYVIDSGEPGPTVMVVGGMHGEEHAGWRSAEEVRHWPIDAGKMVVVPALNVGGLAAGTRDMVGIEDETLRNANRNFPKTGAPDEAFTPPCIDLWNLTKEFEPEWAIDLHEGYDFHISNSDSVGSSAIHYADRTGELATEALERVNATIDDPERKFVPLGRGHVDGSWLRACAERMGINTFCFETTFTGQPLSRRSRQHRILTSTVLEAIGMIASSRVDFVAPGPGNETVYAALFDGGGASERAVREFAEVIDEMAGWDVRHLGPADIGAGALDGFDVALFPGGSGSAQAEALGEEGRERVKDFVAGGGGYVGSCAGAYLCSARYDWSLGILDASVLTGSVDVPDEGTKQLWYRGESTTVQIELTELGRATLDAELDGPFDCRYHNGPILSPAEREDIPDYRVLAHYRSENGLLDAQRGTMVDTPAIVLGEYGAGWVLAIGPHPESADGLRPLVERALRVVMGRVEVTAVQ